MAKIPLRNYIREIEELIEREHYDEAIAHCRHILQEYPKHIETYRTLGKSFLEARRYSDAADILQRVLSSLPGDFIANLGMSIIREDEGNLDEAIWHMERAFEIQPANNAIQTEMRRLYGRRDGIEPPRVRLTRGALARMYIKGGLFPQAIAEIRAALSEDPDRPDLQALLASVYFQAGQRVEAAEVCSALIKKLPYCYEANRILAEILEDTERSQDARAYRERLYALDPYAAFIPHGARSSDQAPDHAVMIERLDRRPGQSTASEPEWYAGEVVEPTSEKTGQEEIPDWMKEAGWGPASGEAVEGPLDLSEPPDLSVEEEDLGNIPPAGELDETDLPDWLRGMAPPAAGIAAGVALAHLGQEKEPADELDLEAELTDPAKLSEAPDWLREFEPEGNLEDILEPDPAQSFDLSETPEQEASQPSTVEEGELPDWLQGLSPTAAFDMEEAAEETEEAEQVIWEPDESEEPGMQFSEENPPKEAGIWEPESAWSSEEESTIPEPPDAEGMSAIEGTEPTLSPEENDAAFAWLEGLAARQGAEEALLLDAEERLETPPEWIQESIAAAEAEAEAEAPEGTPAGTDLPEEEAKPFESELEPLVEENQTEGISMEAEAPDDLAPSEDLPAWLLESEVEESPDARIFQTPDELVDEETTQVSESEETFLQIDEGPVIEGDTQPTSPHQTMEEAPVEQAAPSEEDKWALESVETVETESSLEAVSSAGESTEEEGVSELSGEQEIAAEVPAAIEAEEGGAPAEEEAIPASEEGALEWSQEDEAAAFAWLESLAARQGAEEALLLQPEERLETPPEWIQDAIQKAEEEAGTETETEAFTPVSATPSETLGFSQTAGTLAAAAAEEVEESAAPAEDSEPEETTLPQVEPYQAVQEVEAQEPVEAEEQAPEEAPVSTAELDQAKEEEQAWKQDSGLEVESEQTEPAPELSAEPETEATQTSVHEEELPELPPWLAEIEASEETEEVPWTPPEEGKPRPLVDLNRAALNELERLPGIGFIRAQSIIQHRERNGDFSSVEELLNIPGFDSETLAEVREYLFVEIPAPEQPLPPPQVLSADVPLPETVAPEQVTLIQARNALAQGNRDEALVHYTELIRTNRLLPEVIQDLHEALYRFPVDVEIWQALGDAYIRSDRLNEALEAYTKAEELLR